MGPGKRGSGEVEIFQMAAILRECGIYVNIVAPDNRALTGLMKTLANREARPIDWRM